MPSPGHENLRLDEQSKCGRSYNLGLNTQSNHTSTKAHAAVLATGILLSRLVGLVRDRIFAHYFGNSDAADAFRDAFCTSVLGWLFLDVIDHEHGHWSLLRYQFQPEPLGERVN
jgi:hypothetical protein